LEIFLKLRGKREVQLREESLDILSGKNIIMVAVKGNQRSAVRHSSVVVLGVTDFS